MEPGFWDNATKDFRLQFNMNHFRREVEEMVHHTLAQYPVEQRTDAMFGVFFKELRYRAVELETRFNFFTITVVPARGAAGTIRITLADLLGSDYKDAIKYMEVPFFEEPKLADTKAEKKTKIHNPPPTQTPQGEPELRFIAAQEVRFGDRLLCSAKGGRYSHNTAKLLYHLYCHPQSLVLSDFEPLLGISAGSTQIEQVAHALRKLHHEGVVHVERVDSHSYRNRYSLTEEGNKIFVRYCPDELLFWATRTQDYLLHKGTKTLWLMLAVQRGMTTVDLSVDVYRYLRPEPLAKFVKAKASAQYLGLINIDKKENSISFTEKGIVWLEEYPASIHQHLNRLSTELGNLI